MMPLHAGTLDQQASFFNRSKPHAPILKSLSVAKVKFELRFPSFISPTV